jgi:UDP-N-acetylglucosamine 1-carboxyvinyltransferase
MEKFVIEGGHRLEGTVRPNGSKNEALPVIAGTLLCERPITLENVPRIADVDVMFEILERMGSSIVWHDAHTVTVDTTGVGDGTVPIDLCRRLRASILLAGPLLARFGRVVLAPPGGDVIGRRRLDTHFLGFEALGAEVDVDGNFVIEAEKLEGADILLDEPSVTGTENVLMAAIGAQGRTILRNAACEPHVQGLCRMLVGAGARIDGIGTNTLVIDGGHKVGGGRHRIGPDYLEVGSFVGLAAMTGSELTIDDVVPEDLRMIRMIFARLGVEFEFRGNGVLVPGGQNLRIRSDYLNQIPKIDDAPWPMFPTDMMSIAITTATQAEGTVLFFEKMFDGRMFFVDSLVAMGARIILCDPHRIVVTGPSPLVGSTLESPDVRAGMALLIASRDQHDLQHPPYRSRLRAHRAEAPGARRTHPAPAGLMRTLHVGGPPEHFNYPWHLAIAERAFEAHGLEVCWHDMPAGTGAMVEALASRSLDVALLLTEGIVAAIDRGVSLRAAGTWVESPLVWGVHVAERAEYGSFTDLRRARFAISRPGSGSQLMARVEALRRGWDADALEFVVVGGIDGARRSLAEGTADAFLWEKYTTRPQVRSGEWKCIDEVQAPWPAFVVGVAASADIPVQTLLDVVGPRCAALKSDPAAAVVRIAAHYGLHPDDVARWLADVRWTPTAAVDLTALQRARTALGG